MNHHHEFYIGNFSAWWLKYLVWNLPLMMNVAGHHRTQVLMTSSNGNIFPWGIHRSTVNSLHKGQWRGALMFTLICTRINAWVNNREAGDLRCPICPLWRHCNGTLVQVMARYHQTPSHYLRANVDPNLCHHMASLSHKLTYLLVARIWFC